MGFEQALSGLQAATQDLDNIGNNIANASTVGFKDVTVQFSDVYASTLWGATATQIGLGVQVASVTPNFTQGNITTTGNPLDIAINGQGFFQELNNGITSYSRDGEFQLNANGVVVNSSGAQLLGYPAVNGVISQAPPVPLTLSQAPVPPAATTTATLSVNLDAGSTPVAAGTVFNPAISTTYTSSTSMTVYDSQGNAHTLSYYFVNTGLNGANDDVWNVYATGDGAQLGQMGTLTFGPTGTMVTVPAGQDVQLAVPAWNLTNGANPLNITTTFPFASTSQYGVAFSVSGNSQNGYATGQLAGFSIGDNGVITGQYTNGQTLAQGQIALANFVNPQGLISVGNNQFVETQASGAPLVGAPGAGSLGTVQSGALEGSTVDITTELVNLITAQRVYQANAETVKTEDQVEQTLMNLR